MAMQCNATEGRLVAGENGREGQIKQMNDPRDVIIDRETNSLIIADKENRRVMRWSRQNNIHTEVISADIDCCKIMMDKYRSR